MVGCVLTLQTAEGRSQQKSQLLHVGLLSGKGNVCVWNVRHVVWLDWHWPVSRLDVSPVLRLSWIMSTIASHNQSVELVASC